MAEYIGSRISLISKRDIRYVGTLHEISSENSTVALEQVKSFGTEGRNPEDEVPASDNVYEYIVFRGSDVKDLRIEKEPEKSTQKPQVPDDPAILGNARPIGTPSSMPQAQNQQQPLSQPPQQIQQNQQQQQQQRFQQQPPHQQGPPRFQQQQYFPQYYPPPPNQRFGPGGPQGFPPHGYPPMPYASPPPGWYPPPGQGFPHLPPGQFYPPPMPFGAPGQPHIQQGPPSKPSTPAEPLADNAPKAIPQQELPVDKPTATVKLPSSNTTPAPAAAAQNGPPPPTESKPNVFEALAPPAPVNADEIPVVAKPAISAPKSGRIMPAVPILSPAVKPKPTVNGALKSSSTNVPATSQIPAKLAVPLPTQVPTKSPEDANRDARAAVAAAMAKLPAAPGQRKQTNGESAIDNLTNKVNEMRTNDNIRTSRQPGTGGYAAGHRGGRGGYRGGRQREEQPTKKMEVPQTDYDFAEANAKFNKQDLVKEAIATGSPVSSPIDGSNKISAEASINGGRRESEHSVVIPAAPSYNKTSSFFDNISSESKDRDDGAGKRVGGREFRSEEQKKNLETFGQGSVDNGYRGGFRGRSRGRGHRGARGNHAPRGERGAMRARGSVVAES
ncbi:MAG: hypothetical protein ASARMPREDX12_004194 [Alectoria sarmentosa]|nr:MAG: hypothetical protein ASARMPRED_000202 [Alectoria sarmentosa]CAD6590118.1 MAG: hypothetical protein ASARMPREDX12_004194 [Alectoria sarmentosa]